MTYSNTLALSRRQNSPGYRNKNLISFRLTGKRLGPISNTIILIVLACLVGLLYLTQVTKAYPYSVQINKLQQQKTQLQSENDNLQVAAAQLQSVQRVQNSAQAKQMVGVTPSGSIQ